MLIAKAFSNLVFLKKGSGLPRSCNRPDERLSDNRIWLIYPRNSGSEIHESCWKFKNEIHIQKKNTADFLLENEIDE